MINQPKPEIFQTKNAELKIEDDFLVSSATDSSGETISYILRVVNDNEAIIEGLGRSMWETIRVISDNLKDTVFIHSGVKGSWTQEANESIWSRTNYFWFNAFYNSDYPH